MHTVFVHCGKLVNGEPVLQLVVPQPNCVVLAQTICV